MANTIYIKVDDLQDVLESFDQIQVFRSATSDGTFTEITTTSTRIDMNDQDDLYTFEDSSGTSTDWYKTAFYNSSTTASGTLSDPFQASTLEQLKENMQVTILIDESVKNTSGVSLTEDHELYFTTKYNPLYCSIKKIRLDIGNFLGDIPNDTINLAIFEASREADALTFVKDKAKLDSPLYKHARHRFTCCLASEILMANLIGGAGGGVKSKRLGDFAVEYDTLSVENMLNKLRDCIAQWELQLRSAGQSTQTGKMVIKGDRDPDRPAFGRTWETSAPFNRIPIGNAKIKFRGHRRWRKTGRLPRIRKMWWETD